MADSDGRLREMLARAGLGGLDPRVAIALAAACAVGLAWCAWRWFGEGEVVPTDSFGTGTEAVPGALESTTPAEAPRAVVHVVGAVLRPGVYELAPGSRVRDAVAAAGGLLGSAAPEGLNLARLVADGEQLRVPTQAEASAGVPSGGAAGGVSGGGQTGGKVNLNTADVSALDTLPGVGPTTAKKIVDDRAANGPFRTVEDLMRVPGIGAKRLEDLRDLVTTG